MPQMTLTPVKPPDSTDPALVLALKHLVDKDPRLLDRLLGDRLDEIRDSHSSLEDRIDEIETTTGDLDSRLDQVESTTEELGQRLDDLPETGQQLEQSAERLIQTLQRLHAAVPTPAPRSTSTWISAARRAIATRWQRLVRSRWSGAVLVSSGGAIVTHHLAFAVIAVACLVLALIGPEDGR